MTRRVFYVALGATVGVLVFRQLRKTADAMLPANVAGGLADRVRAFSAEVRMHAAEREGELRRALGLDVVDGAAPREGTA